MAAAPAATFPRLRSTREKLSGGGKPSGPLSFLKVYDQVANVVKSGGKTRRAAKMNTLKDWHPDIEEFIDAKQKEEKKAWALIEQGYDGSYNGDAYGSVMYQNENLSVRVSDEFMHAALNGRGMVDATGARRFTLRAERCADVTSQNRAKALTSAAIPECSSIPPFTNGTPAKERIGKILPTPAVSTFSWITPLAIWRR